MSWVSWVSSLIFPWVKCIWPIEPDYCLPVFIMADILSSLWWKTWSHFILGYLKKKKLKWIKAFCRFTKPLALLHTPVSVTSVWCGSLQMALWFWVSKMLGEKKANSAGIRASTSFFPSYTLGPCTVVLCSEAAWDAAVPASLKLLAVSLVQLLSPHKLQLWGERVVSVLTALSFFSCFGVEFCKTVLPE